MATQDLRDGQILRSHAGAREVFTVQNVIDFAQDNVAAADVVQALDVFTGWLVKDVVVEVLTAEGAVATIDVGDGADPDGWVVDADGNAVGVKRSTPAFTLSEGAPNIVNKESAYGFDGGKLYTADDTIDLVPSAALANAKVRVTANVVDTNAA